MTPERFEQIEELFAELADLGRSERARRLAVISQSEPDLHADLESLLAAHDEADDLLGGFEELISQPSFEKTPPGEAEASIPDPFGLIGRTISHYKVTEMLGAGGMGVLYRAEDTRLDRFVALKFLPQQWSLDATFKERFLREARAVAALDHPNVCTVYEVGETDEGQLFIAMAFYEGETLMERIARGPLGIEEAVGLARQAAKGLAAAHEAGIIHRDIKPANLMLTERGVLKVLDFGLAKTAEEGLTETGMRLGTPAYMSPEQTRGEPVDGRTDLWALGVVLYEMLTGKRPFQGERSTAVIYAIQYEEPERPAALRDDMPAELEGVVLRLLAKDPEARNESAEELAEILAGPVTPSAAAAAGPSGLIQVVRPRALWQVVVAYAVGSWLVIQATKALDSLLGFPLWFGQAVVVVLALGLPVLLLTAVAQSRRRGTVRATPKQQRFTRLLTWRRALLGGVAAFALLGVATAIYMGMRTLGIGPPATLIAQGVLEDRGRLIVAEFENQTRDSLLAPAITEAMLIDLAQSPVLKVLERRDLETALERMEESPDAKLDVPLARELALREGVGAVVSGRISQVGTGYSLSAQLVTPRGDVLTSARETAADDTEVIFALDRLSKKLRERIGESLRSIRNSRPLGTVTTANLEALRKYALARRVGGADLGVSLHEEALALDPTFAMAWRSLGAEFQQMGENRDRTVEAFTKAFEYRDRVPDRERYLIEADYYGIVTGELDKAIAAYDSLIALTSDDPDGWAHFAAINNKGIRYLELRQFARAEELFSRELERIAQVDPLLSGGSIRRNLAVAKANLGKYDEALATLDLGRGQYRLGITVNRQRGTISAASGDYEAAEALYLGFAEVTEDGTLRRASGFAGLAALASLQGRLEEVERWRREELAVHEARGSTAEQLESELDLAERYAWVLGDMDAALRTIERALLRHPIEGLQPFNRPYTRLASLYAVAGRPNRGAELMAEYDSLVTAELRKPPELASEYHRARGEIALARGDLDAAIEEFRRSDIGPCPVCALPGLARAYERAGNADSALALYERYVSTPYARRLYTLDQLFLARSYERLGELFERSGNLENSATYYGKFVSLWSGADGTLRPRVRRAEQRLEELCSSVDCDILVEPASPMTGSLTVRIVESGKDLDLNGYVVRIDLGDDSPFLWIQDPLTKKIPGNGAARIPGIEAGTHTAHLIDIWENCEVDDSVQRFIVEGGGSAEVVFEVTCSEQPPATVDVTGTWAGEFTTITRGFDAGEITIELEQVGDDVVGSWTMVQHGDEVDPGVGELTGRVSERALTTTTEFGGDPGSNAGRIHFFLDVSGDRMEGEMSWDGIAGWGTIDVTRR